MHHKQLVVDIRLLAIIQKDVVGWDLDNVKKELI
jgi:hypothetical protein